MSLIHYLKPFFDLGICKEYRMARKATGNGAPTRSKRTATPLQPVEAQGAADLSVEVSEISNETPRNETTQREAREVRNGKPLNPVPINHRSLNQNPINQSASNQNSTSQNSGNQNSTLQSATNQGSLSPEIEEEIRHRAYELYMQRRANGDDSSGDPHQDWLTAEREVLSRRSKRERKSA
jgi:hypothetical protein